MTVGGYNKSIVSKPHEILWIKSYSQEHWQILVESIKFEDTMIL